MSANQDSFSDQIKEIERRKLTTRNRRSRSEWMGLGVMGIIGWSVVIPAVLGTALGVWLDKKYPQGFSWTLTFMIGGLMLGCAVAYQWLSEETKKINDKNTESDE